MRKCFLTIPLWGAPYVDRFMRYTLPSLRAPGNLLALADAYHLEVLLMTGADEAAAVSRAMADTGIDHHWLLADRGYLSGHAGTVMKELFQKGFDRAWAHQALFIPVCADAVYSDGFFASAIEKLEGHRAVLTQGSGICVDDIGAWLRSQTHDGVMAVPARTMMREYLRTTEGVRHLPSWPGTRLYPAQMFWGAGDNAVLMRCCHMYPAILDATHHATMAYSPDNDLAELTLDSLEQIAWLTDSDDGFFFGLAERGNPCLDDAKPRGDTSLEHFCTTWMSPWKAHYFGKSIIWHADDASIEGVARAQAASDEVIAEIMATYDRVHS